MISEMQGFSKRAPDIVSPKSCSIVSMPTRKLTRPLSKKNLGSFDDLLAVILEIGRKEKDDITAL